MTTLNCEDKSPEVRCCRYPLTIDFESFGWEWVIAPKRYEANYCSGECGLLFMNSYPHTHLMQQANMYNPTGPCCSPRKMSPISMLYMDADYNIIYGILPNMVVDKCDCSWFVVNFNTKWFIGRSTFFFFLFYYYFHRQLSLNLLLTHSY